MFTIGEFSRLTGLSVKTLRFYHEQRLIVPSVVDLQTGYRRYTEAQVETARVVAELRKLEFPLAVIHELLTQSSEDDLLRHVERQREVLARKVKAYRQTIKSLDRFIEEERRAKTMAQAAIQVEEKILQPLLIASIRIKGRYSDCGKGFAQLSRSLGRHICGKPLLLHHDDEYKEDDADFEACMPVRRGRAGQGISIQELPGGRCISLVHAGPYEHLGHSYAKVLRYLKAKGYGILMPTREVYLKGPGMLFKGNPANYLTEIQFLVQGNPADQGAHDEAATV